MTTVTIANTVIGEGQPCFVIAEIGINHNGDMKTARKLIDAAVFAGCDAVKFQKRTVDVVYRFDELAQPRDNPFGPTNGDLKYGLEFGLESYQAIHLYCQERGMIWFASPWDKASVDFLESFHPPCYKIASACLTDDDLLVYVRSKNKPVILSTGMSTMEQIDHAVRVLGHEDLILMHCTSTYPCQNEELNLRMIPVLRDRYQVPVGYSGHEVGLPSTAIAVALGACVVERHITLDRAMWGSDQAASIEPEGLFRLVKWLRSIPTMMGDGVKRVYASEVPVRKKLRRVHQGSLMGVR